MDKSKGKKKASKSGAKTSKKKTATKKPEKSSKKKKTSKKNEQEEEQENIEVVEQKEKNIEENEENLKEKLNQPLTKKKLPPIEKNGDIQDQENPEDLELNEYDVKLEEKNNENENDINKENVPVIEEPIEKIETSVGTPFFYDIGGLKSDVEEQNKKINEANISQEKYKLSLNNLLNDLNKLLSENVELLYDEGDEEEKRQKMEKINYLQKVLYSYQHQMKEVKEKNKTYKQHYELLQKKDELVINKSTKEFEALIEEKKNDNNNLNKKISELKQSSQIGRKKLEAYSENVKYPQDINNLANQLKTLLKKKADYFSKLNKEIKTLNICKKELETLEKFYDKKKKEKNFTNPKIEEDMRRLKEDLTGNESEIYNKVQNDQAFIVRKQIHQEKVNNIFKTPVINKPQDAKKMKLKKGNSLEPLTMKAIRYDVRSGYNSRRMNIVAKNKSPGQNTYEKNSTNSNSNNVLKKENNNNILEEEDLSNINYNTFTDFEYRELLTKKEHCYDVTQRLEKSIKEAVKMYTRKIKEIKITLSENSKKLLERKEENTKLESEIEDLKRILSLTEEEAKLNNMNNINNNKLPEKIKNKNDINEKELDSQKEYLSPEYYNSNKNKKSMEKKVLSNNDLTGNDLLNDLKGLNVDQTGPLISGQEGQKMNNINMKFPDLSNIEDDKNEKNIIINNEFDRSKAIDDIKKKYNIKKTNIEENNDIDIDENELNFGEKMQNKKNENDNDNENIEDINDENKFFKENENILKNDEIGQYEPPIDNEIEVDNNNNNNNNNNVNIEEKKIEEDANNNINTNNINKEEININNNENNENLIEPEKKEEDKVNIKKEEEKEEEKEKEDLNENKEKEKEKEDLNENKENKEKEDLNEINNENNNEINNENNNNEDNNSRFGNYINREISNNERSGLMVVEQKENRGIIETDLNNENINNKEIEQDNNEQNENKEIKEDNNINNNEIEQKEENKEMKENIEVNSDENKVEKEEKIEMENNLDNQEENQNQNKQEDENININEIENQDNKENNEEQQNLENQKEIENINENNLEEEKKEEINDNKEEIENNAEEKKEEEKKEETEIKNEEVEEQKENKEENKEVQEQEDKKEINEAELENNNEEKKDEKLEGETEEKKEEKTEEKNEENKEENKKADDELDMDDLQI